MLPLKRYFKEPEIMGRSMLKKYGKWLPDEIYVRWMFRLCIGYKLDLNSPKTFNEKIQWLKLYNRKPEYTKMVDKYAVKKHVASIIGDEYVIPTLGVWDKPKDIEWEKLPAQFVLKTTHGGGNTGVIICRDKNSFDKEKAIVKLNMSLKQDIYRTLREWPYKNVTRRIIAESYMEDKFTGELRDYKFFCFDGKVKALFIATERGTGNVKFDFFDENFNHLDLVQIHPLSGLPIQKPKCFEKMKEVASQLSKGLPHVRIDLYEVNGKIYFGEYTFYHHGGVVPFHPERWDEIFGSWINLPPKND